METLTSQLKKFTSSGSLCICQVTTVLPLPTLSASMSRKNANMKTTVPLFCVLCFVCCGVSANEMSETCLKQMGLSIFDLPNLIRDNSREGIRTRGCFEGCLMQKIGLLDGNVINLRKIDEQIDRAYPDSEKKDIIRNTVHECAYSAANDDQCVVAQNFGRCGLDQLRFAEFVHQLT